MSEMSVLERLAELDRDTREEWIVEEARKHGVSPIQLKLRLAHEWRFTSRPKQRAPTGEWTFWYVMAGRGFGKEACVETPVATPYGWTPLGDIQVGDLVFDESGRPCPVLEVFDSIPENAYRLSFSDGTHLDVGAEHLWVTWDRAARKAHRQSSYEVFGVVPPEWPAWRLRRVIGSRGLPEEAVERALALSATGASTRRVSEETGLSRSALLRHIRAGRYVPREPISYDNSAGPAVRTTREIIETFTHGGRGDLNHSIPVCGALDLPERTLPLDPYVLGIWLGDGSSRSGAIAAAVEDQPHLYRELAEFDPHPVSSPILVATYGLHGHLRRMNLLRNKHVPPEYLRSSPSQRLALLQGLMDSDGSGTAASVEFSNTNERLVQAVVELARSLGQKPIVAEGRAVLNGKDCGAKWRVTWRPTIPVFRLQRKLDRVRPLGAQSLRNFHRMIIGWEPIKSKPMRCLTVASRHHTFLLGEAMIPTHNTLTGAQWTKDRALEAPGRRIALIAPTRRDVRYTMVEGETGLLSVIPAEALRGQSREDAWNKTDLHLTLANDTILTGFSSERPDSIRGPQHHYGWGEEVSSWKDANRQATDMESTWANFVLGLRLGAHPKACLTSTPKANRLTRDLVKMEALRLVRGSSYENRENLSPLWWQAVIAPLIGTRTGRQEIEAELLEDVEGALWTRWLIEQGRIQPDDAPALRRIVVGVDPNTTSGESADDAGIIVAGQGHSDKHGYVLEDRTQTRGGPRAWAQAAVDAYHDHKADVIVAEVNNGGEMVKLTIHAVDPSVVVKLVTASRGKRTRAEPVATLYGALDPAKQAENPPVVHHVGVFPELEDEMSTWTPENESPNRMDALVWAITELKLWTAPGRMRSSVPQGRVARLGDNPHLYSGDRRARPGSV